MYKKTLTLSKMGIKSIVLVATTLVLSTSASAATITFSEASSLSYDNFSGAPLAVEGFILNPTCGCMAVQSGFPNNNGTSGLLMGGSNNQSISIARDGGGLFDLIGFDMTLSWYETATSLDVLINGTTSITVIQGMSHYALNLHNVSEVIISGTPGGGYWGMDNLSVAPVPIPAAVWLFGSGLIGLIGIARRKKA